MLPEITSSIVIVLLLLRPFIEEVFLEVLLDNEWNAMGKYLRLVFLNDSLFIPCKFITRNSHSSWEFISLYCI